MRQIVIKSFIAHNYIFGPRTFMFPGIVAMSSAAASYYYQQFNLKAVNWPAANMWGYAAACLNVPKVNPREMQAK